jgi:hypothetical protein
MPEPERVDVAVVTWNTAALTSAALRRLLDSEQGCDLRLLVRDNGSTDGTVEMLSRLVPEAEVEAGAENLGFAAGVNRILTRSDAPWVFLLNSDAWPEPGAIGRLIETARKHPRAAAIGPRLEHPEGGLQHSTFPFPGLRIAGISAFVPRRIGQKRGEKLMLEGFWMHDSPRRVDWAIGAAVLIRRDALDDVGLFDERFFMYVEDLEWCWRASRRGWEILFDPSAVVRHVGNASGVQDEAARTRAYLLNAYRFYRREHGLLSTLAYRGLNLVGASMRYAAARRRGDGSEARFWRANIRAHLTRTGESERRQSQSVARVDRQTSTTKPRVRTPRDPPWRVAAPPSEPQVAGPSKETQRVGPHHGMSDLHLACASGVDYVPHCAAMLHSVLDHLDGRKVHIHYLHTPDIPGRTIELLTEMIERNGGSISFRAMPDEWIEGLPITQHFNRAMWYRIHLPELLPNVDRVLYLDADIVVLDSIEPLWDTDLRGNCIAAVTNVFAPWDLQYPEKLGIPSPSYFNTGVLLMDLDQMRRDNCTGALRDYALAHGERLWFCDQDAMNVLLGDRRLPLHPRWNAMNSLFIFPSSLEVFGPDLAEEARHRPAIRHFEGPGANKPWHYLCDHPMRDSYFEHRRQTPWPDVRLEGVTPRNVLTSFSRRTRRGLAELLRGDPS